jgi:hypothetical protein
MFHPPKGADPSGGTAGITFGTGGQPWHAPVLTVAAGPESPLVFGATAGVCLGGGGARIAVSGGL